MDVENVQVLLVEDEDLIIDMIKDALEDAGFAVTASASARRPWPLSTAAHAIAFW